MASESKNIGIELARFIHVANVDRDMIDSENARALELLAVARDGLQNQATTKKNGGACYSSGESDNVRHDCAIINPCCTRRAVQGSDEIICVCK